MVCNGEISAEQKALAIYFKARIWNIIQRIARKCHTSKSSAVEYANLVASQKRSDNLHRVWRKRSTGLEITTNGSKRFVLRKIDGQFFAQFITEHFHIAFAQAVPIHK
jgi:hypothetical protein